MNDLSEVLNFDQIGSILSYFTGSSFNEHTIYRDYFSMINLLSSAQLDDIMLFFANNKNMESFINHYFQKKVYPIHYIFKNPYLDTEIIDYMYFFGYIDIS